jgi:hypothetical protein
MQVKAHLVEQALVATHASLRGEGAPTGSKPSASLQDLNLTFREIQVAWAEADS